VKKLIDILEGINIIETIGNDDVNISKISFDSRDVDDATLFVAVKGTTSDGHDFIESTIQNGAITILCENLPKKINTKITYVKVKDSVKALGNASSNFYNNPSRKLKLVGITGTNGKTTIATLLYQTFKELGYKTGLISTIENYIDKKQIPSSLTLFTEFIFSLFNTSVISDL